MSYSPKGLMTRDYPNTKPFVNNFEVTSMYSMPDKIDIHLYTEKFNNSVRPILQMPQIFKPYPTPHKDDSFYHPGRNELRDHQNKYKNIPHADYLPSHHPPYYNVKETDFKNIRFEDIFRKND
jgi:hypothetical protein